MVLLALREWEKNNNNKKKKSERNRRAYLVSSEALGQHPVVDVIGDAGERAIDDLGATSLGDALSDEASIAFVGERKQLPVDATSHL